MRRERLRPAHGPDDLAALYALPYDHHRWVDHEMRVRATIEFGVSLLGDCVPGIAADLACGDGAVLDALPAGRKIYGDLVSDHPLDVVGPIEATIRGITPVDLMVSTEVLEHLDDPDAVLVAMGGKAQMLLLSTPISAWGDGNVEHYWAWDSEAVGAMITAAGFRIVEYAELPLWYRFGVWGCVR